jgi:guanylate kinase
MQKVLGELKEGIVFVVSAPAGTGKTTLVRMLCQEFPCVVQSISFTTRKPRPNEIRGQDYHFVDKAEFEKRIAENDFLEYATVFDAYYGTSCSFVEKVRISGKHVVLVIDTQGALQLMGKLAAVTIFISPPNLAELQKRLSSRRSENSAAIAERLSWAQKEMATADHYDYQIVNDTLEIAYKVLRSIFIAEEHRSLRRKDLS